MMDITIPDILAKGVCFTFGHDYVWHAAIQCYVCSNCDKVKYPDRKASS